MVTFPEYFVTDNIEYFRTILYNIDNQDDTFCR